MTGISCENFSPEKCLVCVQCRSSRHQKTTWTVWSKEMNVIVLICYFLGSPPDKEENHIRGFRKKCIASGRKE